MEEFKNISNLILESQAVPDKTINIYGFKPIAIHLMPVFQHINNPKKAEGV